jgi:hypothetical protein
MSARFRLRDSSGLSATSFADLPEAKRVATVLLQSNPDDRQIEVVLLGARGVRPVWVLTRSRGRRHGLGLTWTRADARN